jgi:hypothetical protein
LVVGDRLDTDIAGARAAGLTSALVLSGVTGAEALVHARSGERPHVLAHDLSGLLAGDWVPLDGPASAAAAADLDALARRCRSEWGTGPGAE